MTRSGTDLHAHADVQVSAMMSAAMRANEAAISTAVKEAILRGRLDGYSADFLRRARAYVLAASVALTGVLRTHRYVMAPYGVVVCGNCGIAEICRTLRDIDSALSGYATDAPACIDRGEAWRRADASLNNDPARPVLVAVEEFPDGFATWPAHCDPPTDDQTLLVVDKRTGQLSRWPLLSKDVLVTQYRNYLNGRPMEIEHRPEESR